jgi:hypothetical protein
MPEPTLRDTVLKRLDAAAGDDNDWYLLVLAALEGQAEAGLTHRPRPSAYMPEPEDLYLSPLGIDAIEEEVPDAAQREPSDVGKPLASSLGPDDESEAPGGHRRSRSSRSAARTVSPRSTPAIASSNSRSSSAVVSNLSASLSAITVTVVPSGNVTPSSGTMAPPRTRAVKTCMDTVYLPGVAYDATINGPKVAWVPDRVGPKNHA